MEIQTDEVSFIEHCDSPDCCLGSAYFTCPNCKKKVVDYDLWWAMEELNKTRVAECEYCDCKLELYFEDGQARIRKIIKNKDDEKRTTAET